MQAEAQLGIGAALSMEEIMQRLVEGAQNDLQVGCGHQVRCAAAAQRKGHPVPP